MDLMHEIFGDGMATMYAIALVVGLAGGAVARLSVARRRWATSSSKQS